MLETLTGCGSECILMRNYWSVSMRVAFFMAIFVAQVTVARAATLTYESDVIHAHPGETIEIGGTLSLGAGDDPIVDGANLLGFHVDQQLVLGFVGTPAGDFLDNSMYVAPPSGSYGNLNLNPGQSAHLDLGQVILDLATPAGTYMTDIGLFNDCGGANYCDVNPYAAPDFADAGSLTIDVAVAEPTGLSLLLIGAMSTAAMRRRSRRAGAAA